MSWKLISQETMMQINSILTQVKAHDLSTHDHCVRVSHLCRFLADALELTAEEKLQAQIAGLLHDVGKMKIPIPILNKPGRLTEEEYQLVQKHAEFSSELIAPLVKDDFFKTIQLSVLHHHERVDGIGYPMNLKGEEIPFLSRLILIVDTVDAMTESRPYRKGLPISVVYQELEKFAGQQFDEDIVPLFIEAHQKLNHAQPVASVLELKRSKKAA